MLYGEYVRTPLYLRGTLIYMLYGEYVRTPLYLKIICFWARLLRMQVQNRL